MLKINVTEIAKGYWQASIESEEANAVLDRSPDQALAGLVRANLRRFGIGEILYGSVAEAGEGSSTMPFAHGERLDADAGECAG